LLSASLFVSCAQEGPIGPRGPQGPQGPSGPQGPAGQSADVISINYAADASHWYDVGVPGEDGYFLALDLEVPEITQDIVDFGLVLVYYRIDNQSPWIALPYTNISYTPDYVEKLDVIYNLGFVGLQSQATDRQANAYEGTFRVIVASAIPISKTEMDYHDYDAVSIWLGLEDAPQFTRTIQ
jgi:hypothetical protein